MGNRQATYSRSDSMTWFLFFVFSLIALNSVIIWGLLKKAGIEDTTLLLLSGLCLLSACLMYNSAIGRVVYETGVSIITLK